MEPKPIVELHTFLGILLMNSYEIKICSEAPFDLFVPVRESL